MADKFRNTYPIAINFAAGDMPTHVKLGNLSSAAQLSSRLLERAIGDPWNQSGDQDLVGYPLQQVNLARAIGQMRKISPKVLSARSDNSATSAQTFTYRDIFGARYLGKREVCLKYKPTAAAVDAGVMAGTGWSPSSTPVASRAALTSSGQWYYDESIGKLYLYDAIGNADWYATYSAEIEPDLTHTTTPNVIPDPRYYGYGLRVKYYSGSDASQGYLIRLPARYYPDTEVGDDFSPPGLPGSTFANHSADGTKYWWSASDVLAAGSSKRWLLPVVIRTEVGAGETIPEGLIYIWDASTDTIIQGLTILKEGTNNYELRVTNTDVAAFETAISDGGIVGPALSTDLMSQYPERFYLITAGTSVTDAVEELLDKAVNHSHNGTNGARVSHADLDGLDSQLPSGGIHFRGSFGASDGHPYYFHRAGYSTSRDEYNNAILGDVLIASTTANNADYQHLDADSNRLIFGKKGGGGPELLFNFNSSPAKWEAYNSSGALTTKESNADGFLSIFNGDLLVAGLQDGTPYSETGDARIWFGKKTTFFPTNFEFGLLGWDNSTSSFQLSKFNSSGPSTLTTHLLAKSLVVGITSPTDIALDGYTRKDVSVGQTAVRLSNESSGGTPVADLSVMLNDAETNTHAILRLNSKQTFKPTHTVIDGRSGSYLHLKNLALFFGDVGANEYLLASDDGSTRVFSFYGDNSISNTRVNAGHFRAAGGSGSDYPRFEFGGPTNYLRFESASSILRFGNTILPSSAVLNIGENTSLGRWGTGYFTNLDVTGDIDVDDDLTVGDDLIVLGDADITGDVSAATHTFSSAKSTSKTFHVGAALINGSIGTYNFGTARLASVNGAIDAHVGIILPHGVAVSRIGGALEHSGTPNTFTITIKSITSTGTIAPEGTALTASATSAGVAELQTVASSFTVDNENKTYFAQVAADVEAGALNRLYYVYVKYGTTNVCALSGTVVP